MVLVDVECLSPKLTAANLNKRKRSAKGVKEWSRWSREQNHLCRISCRAHAIDLEGPQAPPRIQGCLHLEEKRFGVLVVPRRKKNVRSDRIKNNHEKQLYFKSQIACPSQGTCAIVGSQIPELTFRLSSCRSFSTSTSSTCGLGTWTMTVRLFSTPLSLLSGDHRPRRSSSIPRSRRVYAQCRQGTAGMLDICLGSIQAST